MSDVRTGQDSTGKSIFVGSKVRFRGQVYTIKAFIPGKGRYGSNGLSFEETVHTTETPDEIAIDVVHA